MIEENLGKDLEVSEIPELYKKMKSEELVKISPKNASEATMLIAALSSKLAVQKSVKKKLKALETVANAEVSIIERKLLKLFDDLDLIESMKFTFATVTKTSRDVFNIKDWDSFFKWIIKTRDSSFLSKKCSSSAAKEMLKKDGILPNGVEMLTIDSIKVTMKS